jgi:hypothetical protein
VSTRVLLLSRRACIRSRAEKEETSRKRMSRLKPLNVAFMRVYTIRRWVVAIIRCIWPKPHLNPPDFYAPSGLTLDFRLPLPTNLPGGENFIQPFMARDLNVVQDLRHTADYRDSNVSRRQATRALAKASGGR